MTDMSMQPKRNKGRVGAIASIAVAVLAVIGLGGVFLANASPYVNLAQARTTSGNNLHLAGELEPGSISNDLATHELKFRLTDENGETTPVIYTGSAPSNLGEATKIVAIGKLDGEVFRAHKLLVKCPSKYEGTQKA